MAAFQNIRKKAVFSLTLTFGLIFAVATALIYHLDMPLKYGLYVSLIVAGLQYLINPLIIELLFSINFERQIKNTNPELYEFLEKTCAKLKMEIPKVGFIDDGNPNAFTYGHIPRNARIVLTTGLTDILNEEELEAVVAHELGHIKNYDFILMTIVSVIPMILYQIYAFTGRNRNNPTYFIGLMAYGAYILSQYAVLFYSRIREYYADDFSMRISNSSEALSNALIKIAYGFTKMENKKPIKANALGVINNLQSQGFVLNHYKALEKGEAVEKLIGWDTKSIWGKLYELNSTHPLTAKRIMAMKGKYIENARLCFKSIVSFITEVIVNLLPYGICLIIALINISENIVWDKLLASLIRGVYQGFVSNPMNLSILGLAMLVRHYFIYRKKHEPSTIEELLIREDASPIKGIPAVLEGNIVGRGVPGLFYSEDLVLDDDTGIMILDYRQPLRILEFLFGAFKAEELIGQRVKVIGWYKRANRPYFICKSIIMDGEKVNCYSYFTSKILAYGAFAAGLIMYII